MEEQFITEDMLNELGIDLTDQDKETLLTHLNDTLKERIGVEITESLTDEQLKELLSLQESADDEAINQWLEQRVPDLEDIVRDNIAILLSELTKNTDGTDTAA